MASVVEREGKAERGALRWASAWLPVALWIAVIWTLGGAQFGEPTTTSFIAPLLHALFPALTPEALFAAGYVLRVLAHPAEYGILALLAQRAFRATVARPWAPLGGTLALVLAVAAADEARQAPSPGRTGAITDVALDFAGGVAALAIAFRVRRLRG